MSETEANQKKQPAPLPIWAKIGRIVAVAGALALFLIAFLTWRADPADQAYWERIGGWVFNAMVIGVVALFVGRFQSRR
ncbi:MAG: hypothetical protein R2722_05600 [Tessaracoccus sp.]